MKSSKLYEGLGAGVSDLKFETELKVRIAPAVEVWGEIQAEIHGDQHGDMIFPVSVLPLAALRLPSPSPVAADAVAVAAVHAMTVRQPALARRQGASSN